VGSILVTGAAGFIGTNFVRYWVEQHPGDHVVAQQQTFSVTSSHRQTNFFLAEEALTYVRVGVGSAACGDADDVCSIARRGATCDCKPSCPAALSAVMYPEDYDGVLSGAPAINWAHFLPAGMWPQLVMNELHPVPQCKLEAARRAAVAACDREDGVQDGLIGDINMCAFDPKALVGTQTACGVIDEQDAEVIRRIWDGPRRRDGSRLWYGLDRGATFNFAAMTGGDPLQGQPNPIVDSWFKYFLTQDPNWSVSSLTRSGFESLFDQSVEQYGDVFDTSRANIRAFADHGGRTIIWHGLADNNFTANGSIQYVDSIRRELGAQRTNDFLRFYLAPGVAHCAGGDGPQPVALLNTLMDWVERGRAPSTLMSGNRNRNGDIIRTRPLCPYPQRALYRGRGSIGDATNFRCSR
jgi:hypothetical protein